MFNKKDFINPCDFITSSSSKIELAVFNFYSRFFGLFSSCKIKYKLWKMNVLHHFIYGVISVTEELRSISPLFFLDFHQNSSFTFSQSSTKGVDIAKIKEKRSNTYPTRMHFHLWFLSVFYYTSRLCPFKGPRRLKRHSFTSKSCPSP